jgi:hypothetical protein
MDAARIADELLIALKGLLFGLPRKAAPPVSGKTTLISRGSAARRGKAANTEKAATAAKRKAPYPKITS